MTSRERNVPYFAMWAKLRCHLIFYSSPFRTMRHGLRSRSTIVLLLAFIISGLLYVRVYQGNNGSIVIVDSVTPPATLKNVEASSSTSQLTEKTSSTGRIITPTDTFSRGENVSCHRSSIKSRSSAIRGLKNIINILNENRKTVSIVSLAFERSFRVENDVWSDWTIF